MRRLPLILVPLLAASAAAPAAARVSCDTYGRCFEFSGPGDRLAGGDAGQLWQRTDLAAPRAPVAEAAVEGGPIIKAAADPDPALDPLALAHGTIGERVEDFDSDD